MKPKHINNVSTSKIQMKKSLILVLTFVFLLVPVMALNELGDPGEPEECYRIKQLCASCSYVNISSITYPNHTVAVSNIEMSSFNNGEWYYDFCLTPVIGRYDIGGQGDINGIDDSFATITYTGEEVTTTQGLILLAQLGVVALLFGFGRIFNKTKWLIKMFFDMMSALMTLVLINSLKIVSSQSFSLNKMGEMAFYIGFVLVSFLFLYLFVNATIEVVNYLKNKKDKKWGVNIYE